LHKPTTSEASNLCIFIVLLVPREVCAVKVSAVVFKCFDFFFKW
jgi:hypothetical protein